MDTRKLEEKLNEQAVGFLLDLQQQLGIGNFFLEAGTKLAEKLPAGQVLRLERTHTPVLDASFYKKALALFGLKVTAEFADGIQPEDPPDDFDGFKLSRDLSPGPFKVLGQPVSEEEIAFLAEASGTNS